MTIYQALLRSGCEIDSHESDLYVRASPQARAILENWPRLQGATLFRSLLRDGAIWIDIPFAFDPWWEARRRNAS